MLKEGILSIFNKSKDRAQRFQTSIFDIQYSAVLRFAFRWFCGLLFNCKRDFVFLGDSQEEILQFDK